MFTFYLAGASTRVLTMKERIAELEKHGFVCSYNWTKEVEEFGPEGDGTSKEFRMMCVMNDIQATVGSDYFVACIGAPPPSRGAYMELGARLGAAKVAHVVLEDLSQHHLFFNHPLVKVWESWEGFVTWLVKE